MSIDPQARLDFIDLPRDSPGPSAREEPKVAKPNFFHEYKKKSMFLHSNQENRTALAMGFARRVGCAQLGGRKPSREARDSRERAEAPECLHPKKFSKLAKSHGELNTRQWSPAGLRGNFEFQKAGGARGESGESGESEASYGEESESNLERKFSEDICFSKKELSKDESLLSHSSGAAGDSRRQREVQAREDPSFSSSSRLQSKKFGLERDIERRRRLQRLLSESGAQAKGKLRSANKAKALKTRKKNRIRFDPFGGKAAGERKKKKPRKKGPAGVAEIKAARKSLHLKGGAKKVRTGKKEAKRARPKDLTSFLQKISKTSFKCATKKSARAKVVPFSLSGLRLLESARERRLREREKKTKRRRKGKAKARKDRKAEFLKALKMSKTLLNNTKKLFGPDRPLKARPSGKGTAGKKEKKAIDWYRQIKQISFPGFKTREENLCKKAPAKAEKAKEQPPELCKGARKAGKAPGGKNKKEEREETPGEKAEWATEAREERPQNFFVDYLRLNSRSGRNDSSFGSQQKRWV